MTQTAAIFLDAYRNLNSKKLFWVTLVISAIVVVAFACVGINDQGLKILAWQIDTVVNAKTMPPATFYKQIFVVGGVNLWLAWLAAILALISTAGIFPDLISSGVIDLFVSKPIGRLRLFLTEYVAGLLFVTLQVTIFSAASFLVIGLRGGVWEPGLFVAVPVVVCFFSYLFSVCALLGVLSRSTVAAMLLTLLFWFIVYAIGAAEQSVLMFQAMEKHGVTLGAEMHRPPAPRVPRRGANGPAAVKNGSAGEREQSPSATLETLRQVLHAAMTVLPKTTETVGLLQRWLIKLADLPREGNQPAMLSAQREVEEALYRRSPFWIVGTSLAFELVILSWAGWLFCRRDF